jgi:hypothetical protein
MASTYAVQPGVEIQIESIGGDLIVEGQTEDEIRARGDNPDVRIEDEGQRAVVACGGDCRLRVPNHARLEIGSVGSDARITDMAEKITVDSVGSDLVIRDVVDVTVNTVGSDIELKRIKGNVEVETVGADATLREIEGDVRIGHIGSDALMTDISGSCEVDTIGADLVLNVAFQEGLNYHFENVGSDVLAKVRPDADVRFEVPHHVEKAVELQGARFENDGDIDVIVLGSGAAHVKIEAIGAELALISRDKDFVEMAFEAAFPDNLDDIISEQINSQLAGIRRDAERAAEHARMKAEQIAEKVRRNAERMQREVERNAERAQRKHKHGKSWGFDFSWPGWSEKAKHGPIPPMPPMPPMPPFGEKAKRGPDPSTPPGEPISNEERMAILHMVENKQITVEEAERLLAALEGHE